MSKTRNIQVPGEQLNEASDAYADQGAPMDPSDASAAAPADDAAKRVAELEAENAALKAAAAKPAKQAHAAPAKKSEAPSLTAAGWVVPEPVAKG